MKQKKCLILIVVIMCLFQSCELKTRMGLGNTTDEDLNVRLVMTDGNTVVVEAPKNFYTTILYYDCDMVSDAYVEAEDLSIDNAYRVYRYSYGSGFGIEYAKKNVYSVKVAFLGDIETDTLFLADRNRGIGRYCQPYGQNLVQLKNGLITNIEVYGSPDFVIVDDTGKEVSDIDGYSIAIRKDNDSIFIE